MTPRLDALSLTTADLAASLAFYRRLGLDIPAGAESAPHVEVTLPGGQRLLWDTEDVVRSFDPEWSPPQGGGPRGRAVRSDDPAGGDAGEAERTRGGKPRPQKPG
ncbi:VOC family protein, partial [Streptomyces sp. NPDC055089]